MNDSISRQAAIDVANRADYRGLTVEDVKKVTDEVVKELKKLPPAQPKQKKPCSVCKKLQYGNTLYVHSDSDLHGGSGFDYIRDIKYCPVCGRKLNNG